MKARKLTSGSWNVRIMVCGKSYSFTDPDKRRVMRRASEFAEMCHEDIDNPKLIDCLEKFVEERSSSLSPSTIRGYNSIIRAVRSKHEAIANKRIVSLTDKDIQTIIRGIDSPKTQKNYVTLIQSATGRKFSPTFRKKLPKEVAVPSDLEVLGLIRLFEWSEMEIPVLLGAYAGLRRGEICALTMGDFDGDYVTINKDKVMDEFGGYVIKDPKTETSNRTILLPHFIVEAIREKGYVTKLTPHQISNYFQKRQMSLGVEPPYCFHSLRHYNASFLHSQGIPDAYIMARGGWASPHVMQRVYRHALQDKVAGMEQKAVGALQFSLQF